ncbi:MAG: DMT family transporter [Clostridiales bacterium]|nr:DMT family transporter [Clostridiales bacterium]
MKKPSITALAKAALFAAALIWGLSFTVLKASIDIIPPITTIGLRFLIASVFLSVIFFKKFRPLNRDYVLCGILTGVLLGTAYGIQTIGLSGTTPGKNAFLTAGYCIITPFLYWIIGRKRPTKYNITAAVLCMTGFALVSLDGGLSVSRGDFFSALCGFFYALQMCAVAKTFGDKDPVLFSIIQFITAAVCCLGWGFIFETHITYIPAAIIPNLLFLGIAATAIALLFQNIGQKYTNPSAAALILSLESVFGVIFSLILYEDERLTLRLLLGFIFIFAAIIISETQGGTKNAGKNEGL